MRPFRICTSLKMSPVEAGSDASAPMQRHSLLVQSLGVVPIPNQLRVHRRLHVDGLAELHDVRVADFGHTRAELGDHVFEGGWLADAIKGQRSVGHDQDKATARSQNSVEFGQRSKRVSEVFDDMASHDRVK